MSDQLLLFDNPTKPTPEERFEAFHAAHPEVYRELRRRAFLLQQRGWKRYSIKGIWEVMRFDFAMSWGRPSGGFKLNNNYTAYYARLLMEREPELEGFFETRGNGR